VRGLPFTTRAASSLRLTTREFQEEGRPKKDDLSRTPTDIELISGCIENNRQAQERLYKQFYGPMASICLRYTRNDEDAIEVLHNGFLKVFKNIHTYDSGKASLYTWIRTIIVHAAIDFLRQRDRHYSSMDIEKVAEPEIDSEVIQKMKAEEILKLVRKLPQATQTVFNLYVVDGYTHKEIGQLLGISEGTSKWHLSEARRQLQKLLQTMHLV